MSAAKVRVRVDLTHFANRYEQLIYQISMLTPLQRAARDLVGVKWSKGVNSRILAKAGTGKTFIAVDIILGDHLLSEEQTGESSPKFVLFVASAAP